MSRNSVGCSGLTMNTNCLNLKISWCNTKHNMQRVFTQTDADTALQGMGYTPCTSLGKRWNMQRHVLQQGKHKEGPSLLTSHTEWFNGQYIHEHTYIHVFLNHGHISLSLGIDYVCAYLYEYFLFYRSKKWCHIGVEDLLVLKISYQKYVLWKIRMAWFPIPNYFFIYIER